jgi:hypothetical protein
MAAPVQLGRKANSPPPRVCDQQRRAGQHRRPTTGAAVGGQAQLQARRRLRTGSAPALRCRRTPPRADGQRAAQAAVQQPLVGPGDVRRWPARQAVMRSLASAPKTKLGIGRHGVGAAHAALHSRRPRGPASTQPTADWKARAQTRSPTRTAGPTRSARRSTSLVPRGDATATSQRTVPRSGSSRQQREAPARPAACCARPPAHPAGPASARRPGAARSTDGGRRWRRRRARAVDAITKTRSPATSGAVTTRAGTRLRQTSRPFEGDHLVVTRDDAAEAAVAAHARRESPRRPGAPATRAGLGLQRQHGAVGARDDELAVAHGGDQHRQREVACRRAAALQTWRPAIWGVKAPAAWAWACRRTARQSADSGASSAAQPTRAASPCRAAPAAAPDAAAPAPGAPSATSLASTRRR